VRHPTTAMATGERYLFFQINRLHPCLFLLALFFRMYMYMHSLLVFLSLSSTAIIITIMIIHLTGKRCFLRSTYNGIVQIHTRKCRSLQKKAKKREEDEE